VSLKDVGFDLAKGLRGLRRVGFTFLGGWMDLFWENNGRRCGSSSNGSCWTTTTSTSWQATVKGKGKMGIFPTTSHRWSLGWEIQTHFACTCCCLPTEIIDTSMSVCLSPTPWSSSSSRNFVFL
jgi:hypothetical protein